MQSSGTSSPATPPPTPTDSSPGTPTRNRFRLAGRSVALDPLTHAVRGDLADVRLADRVFAPHYAAPLARRVARNAALRVGPGADAAVIGTVAAGAPFEELEVAGGVAWGLSPTLGRVGYIDAAALAAL